MLRRMRTTRQLGSFVPQNPSKAQKKARKIPVGCAVSARSFWVGFYSAFALLGSAKILPIPADCDGLRLMPCGTPLCARVYNSRTRSSLFPLYFLPYLDSQPPTAPPPIFASNPAYTVLTLSVLRQLPLRSRLFVPSTRPCDFCHDFRYDLRRLYLMAKIKLY